MQSKWSLLFSQAMTRGPSIGDFVEQYTMAQQLKIIRFFELLELQGPVLSRPYADLLRDGVHELRLHVGSDPLRFLYFFHEEKYIVICLAFAKRTDRVPEELIELAASYRRKLRRQDVAIEELSDAVL